MEEQLHQNTQRKQIPQLKKPIKRFNEKAITQQFFLFLYYIKCKEQQVIFHKIHFCK